MAPTFPRIGRCDLLFVLIGVLVRTPLFLPLTLYDDEHTFINMAYDVAHGYLPYEHLWDNKPPLMFLLLAPLVILSHHHLWVIRLAAAILDTLTALIVRTISDRLFGASVASWISATCCLAATTLSVAGGALMSETIALPLILSATFLLTSDILISCRLIAGSSPASCWVRRR